VSLICDMRCVACDGVLSGTEEVVIRKRRPPEKVTCKRCGTEQVRTDNDDDISDCYYSRSK
jgi:hypothetical protein